MCYSIQELFYCSTLRTLVHNTNIHMLFIYTQCIHHEVNILLTYILILLLFFQLLLLDSRSMTSCHMTHHMTTVTGLFIIQEKQKQKQNKRNIKLRKIDKKKRKIFKSRHTITEEGCRIWRSSKDYK